MKIAIFAAAAALAMTGDAVAAEKIEWNLSTWGNPRAVTRGFEKLAEIADEKTGGNFKITIAYGETLSPARENLDGISLGAIQMAQFCTSYHPGKNPVGTGLDLPFLPLTDRDVLVKTHHAFQYYPLFQEELARWNARPWISTVLPQYEFMGVGEPPKTLDAWKGMRVRALGGIGEAMRKLGAVPTTVPAPDVYTSLERGVVQAASFPYAYTFASYRLHEISKWFTEGLQPGTVHCPIIINQAAFDKLPPEYKAIVEESVDEAYEALGKAYAEADEKFIPMYKSQMQVVTYTPEQKEEFRQLAAQPVWDDWVEQHKSRFDSQAVLDFILKTAEEAAKGS